jgi:hypothetical protein
MDLIETNCADVDYTEFVHDRAWRWDWINRFYYEIVNCLIFDDYDDHNNSLFKHM